MPRLSRDSLRKHFKAGSRPTEQSFFDLIDSALNMEDEGYRKTPEHGVHITALGGADALVSFYTRTDPDKVQWSMAYGPDTGEGVARRLVFAPRDANDPGASVMTLDPLGRLGVGRDAPEYTLDVNGVLRSAGRVGGFEPEAADGETGAEAAAAPASGKGGFLGLFRRTVDQPRPYEKSPPADGEWHSITGELHGCHAFEVVAGVGDRRGLGRYALLHAVALNAFNPPRRRFLDLFLPRRRIRSSVAWYSSRCDRLELMWEGSNARDGTYRLLVRSRCAYSPGVRIQFHITRLWFDPLMDGSAADEDGG